MSEQAVPREHTGGVLGIALGLGVLAGTLALLLQLGLFQLGGGRIDGAARVAELFRDGRTPFDLELAEAVRLPGGEVLVRLERPGAEPSSGAELASGSAAPGDGTSAKPREVVLVEYSSPAAAAALFRRPEGVERSPRRRRAKERERNREASAQLLRWEEDPSFAWHTTIERDEIQWSRWRADLVVERSFREGGGWRDSARVNLAQPGRALVLFAHWPDETPVDRDVLGRLLRSIQMSEPEGDA